MKDRVLRALEEPYSVKIAKAFKPGLRKNPTSFILTFIIMAGIWVLLSGKFDSFHLSLGVISCIIVAALSCDLLFTSPNIREMPGVWMRFIVYIPWLLYQVFLANIHVMKLTFHPRMMELIEPCIIEFKTTLSDDIALVTLANSITLTPGTITVYVSIYGNLTIHAIDIESSKGIADMEEKVKRIFKR